VHLQSDEMFHHLHIASIHYGLTHSKSIDISTVLSQIVSHHNECIQWETEALTRAYENSIQHILSAQQENISYDDAHRTHVIKDTKKNVQEETLNHFLNQTTIHKKISTPLEYKNIRKSYLEGHNSIITNLPTPTVSILHKSAFIPAKEIINHLLALGIDVRYYYIGYETDWIVSCGSKTSSKFLDRLYQKVSNIDGCSKDIRVVLVQIWSDGFEAHQIKAKNDFTSLQLFTLTILAPNYQQTNSHTVHFALCFKKKNHHMILLQLLQELKELQTPDSRYWGGEERQVYHTMIFLEIISNDLPERCSNTCTTFNGPSLIDGDIHADLMLILSLHVLLVI